MDLPLDIFTLFILVVSVLSWIGSAFYNAFFKARPTQQGRRPPRRPPQEAPLAPDRDRELRGPAAGGAAEARPARREPVNEIQQFLERLRERAEAAQRAEPPGAPAASQEFDAPGVERPQPREREAARNVGWEQYEWEALDPEPPAAPAARPGPPPIPAVPRRREVRPAAQKPVPLPRGPALPVSGGGDESHEISPFSSPFSSVSEISSTTWLSLSEISQSRGTGEIRGISFRDAMILREVLGPPRALRHRRARTGPGRSV